MRTVIDDPLGDVAVALDDYNEDPFEVLYKKHYDELCRFASVLLNDRMAAEEVVDDVFFRFWCRRADIGMPRYYLYKSVRNSCLRQLQSGRGPVYSPLCPDMEAGLSQFVCPDPLPLSDLISR